MVVYVFFICMSQLCVCISRYLGVCACAYMCMCARRFEVCSGNQMEDEYRAVSHVLNIQSICEDHEDLLGGHDSLRVILKPSPRRLLAYVQKLFSNRVYLLRRNNPFLKKETLTI